MSPSEPVESIRMSLKLLDSWALHVEFLGRYEKLESYQDVLLVFSRLADVFRPLFIERSASGGTSRNTSLANWVKILVP